MGHPPESGRADRYAAVIDQDRVTEEVRNVAVNYDPLNRSGRGEGFYVTEDGELHVDDDVVTEAHRIVEKKVPNDAVRIVKLPAERGHLVHQYGENGFRLYELPAPADGRVVALLGRNGVGKTTALRVLAGLLRPNLGCLDAEPDWETVRERFRGTGVQGHMEALATGDLRGAYKPQRVESIPDTYEGTAGDLLAARDERDAASEVASRLDLADLLDRDLAALSGGELQRVAVAATIVADREVYLFDEPSSYLDVGRRLDAARVISAFARTSGRRVIAVEHDLLALDVLADDVHVVYGEPGAFGVVARKLGVGRAINEFLAGFLRAENVRLRPDPLAFASRPARQQAGEGVAVAVPDTAASLDGFDLRVEACEVRRGEVLGVLGPNGLGKSTFLGVLAGEIGPASGGPADPVAVSAKPQYLPAGGEETVGGHLAEVADPGDPRFEPEVADPLALEGLYDRRLGDLSGGERQRVAVAAAAGRPADLYLLDEPSAYLDVEWRARLADWLRRFVDRRSTACLVVDHDLALVDYVADRAMVFEGDPGTRGVGRAPTTVPEAVDALLASVGVTVRRDPTTGRPRANKPGSRMDREQRRAGEFYAR